MDSSRLRQFRESLGLKQSHMAKKLGLSQSTYAQYELGARKIPASLRTTLHELRLNLNWLDTGEGSMLREPTTAERLEKGEAVPSAEIFQARERPFPRDTLLLAAKVLDRMQLPPAATMEERMFLLFYLSEEIEDLREVGKIEEVGKTAARWLRSVRMHVPPDLESPLKLP